MHFVKSSRCGIYLHSASCFIPLNTWNCKAEVALSQLTVCIGVCIIKLIKLLFASFHLLAILGNDSGNEPQDISEVHPSIKGGDIWPKMISMKQQESYGNIGACCLNNSACYSLSCELIPDHQILYDVIHISLLTIQPDHSASFSLKGVDAIWMIRWYNLQLYPFFALSL